MQQTTTTLPAYLQSLQGLDEQGWQWVSKTKQQGAHVRKTHQQFVQGARQLAHVLHTELDTAIENFKTKILDLVHTCLKNNDLQNLKIQIAMMQKQIVAKQQELAYLSEHPPGKQELDVQVELFNTCVTTLVEYAKLQGKQVPWQLRQCAVMDPDHPTDNKVPFEGGRVTDSEGNNIFGATCSLCCKEIQDGATGEGIVRYKSIHTNNAYLCESCFQIHSLLVANNIFVHGAFAHDTFAKQDNIDSFLRFPIVDAPNIAHAIHNALLVYYDRPCLGQWKKNKYEWIKYEQVRQSSVKLASYLFSKLGKATQEQQQHFVGICASENRPEWIFADLACCFNDYVSVGLHGAWPQDEMDHELALTEVSCVICDKQSLNKFITSKYKVPLIICMDDITSDSEAVCSFSSIMQDNSIADATGMGMSMANTQVVKGTSTNDQSLFSIIFSSGSENYPKGIIVTKQGWREDNLKVANFVTPNIVMSYAAMAHGMDRGMCWQTMGNGGQIAFCTESELLDRVKIVEPIHLVAMPHIWSVLYRQFVAHCEKTSKEEAIQAFKQSLGKRIQFVASGGSAIAPEMFAFLQACFPLALNAYGTTEAPGITTNGEIRPGVQVKLRDVPEMEYTNKDVPHPRGEILVKTPTMTPGYYKLPEQTKQLFSDGWICTGDIGMLDASNKLHIIDRKRNMLELYVQGRSQWIAASELENCITKSVPSVKQVFVHGDRSQDAVIAVIVVPANANHATITQQISQAITSAGFAPWCVPKSVLFDTVEWTCENGLLTISGKSKRAALLKKYKLQIDVELAK